MIHLTDLPDTGKIYIQTLDDPLFQKTRIGLHVLRLDKIHTIVSGNKWFKLKYYLREAAKEGKGIITFGGPYSNHLMATAYACRQAGIPSVGIIRGEEPATHSPTLRDVELYGMNLQFVSRQEYNTENFALEIQQTHPDFLIVHEGGRGESGIKGAEEILQLARLDQYTHIMCAIGTGTMMTGIINSSLPQQHIIGIPVIKLNNHTTNTVSGYIRNNSVYENYHIQHDYHFGGYAKRNDELIQFMNRLYHQYSIPTDFVYTGKLFYAAIKLIEKGYFETGSNILLIHSGGLQGNRSLPGGLLHFTF